MKFGIIYLIYEFIEALFFVGYRYGAMHEVSKIAQERVEHLWAQDVLLKTISPGSRGKPRPSYHSSYLRTLYTLFRYQPRNPPLAAVRALAQDTENGRETESQNESVSEQDTVRRTASSLCFPPRGWASATPSHRVLRGMRTQYAGYSFVLRPVHEELGNTNLFVTQRIPPAVHSPRRQCVLRI